MPIHPCRTSKKIAKILNSSSVLNCNKPFWHYIKFHKKNEAGISSLQTSNEVATIPAKKPKVLNNAFQSVFITEDLSSLPTLPVATHPSLPEISITKHGVFTLLSQIDPHKVCWPNNIPAQVLQELAQELTPIITHLFKQSLDISELMPEWKSAYITTIFKKEMKELHVLFDLVVVTRDGIGQ